ncbi:MAG: hypothetical protein M3Q55_12990 [Acidobacteriota bacterium]|nr:hypothetical protein [Acidobacteriota bacterium]
MAHIDSGGDPNSIKAGRELADVAIPSLFHQAFYLVVVCVAVWLLMVGFLKFTMGRLDDGDPAVSSLARPAGEAPPEPRLLIDEPTNLRGFRATETQKLQHYGWADQAAGSVHIPIDAAKELLLQRGLPSRASAAQPAPAPLAPATAPAPHQPSGGGH